MIDKGSWWWWVSAMQKAGKGVYMCGGGERYAEMRGAGNRIELH